MEAMESSGDWQSWAALALVGLTAILMVIRFVMRRRRSRSGGGGSSCDKCK